MNKGLFEPLVMFFGLTNSPATFQSMIDSVFKAEIDSGNVIIYMDDILIATRGTPEEHKYWVHRVLKKLEEHDLYLKPEKCVFEKQIIGYLGVILEPGRVRMDPVKIKGIEEWPTPRKVKDVQSFLGFGNFYRRFIKGFRELAKPLNELTQKDIKWHWDEEQQKSFDTLKERFISQPVLNYVDFGKAFFVETDTSAFATGAVLLQHDNKGALHPVAYYSSSFSQAERGYNIYN